MSEPAAQTNWPGSLPFLLRLWQMHLLAAAILAGLFMLLLHADDPEVFFSVALLSLLLALTVPPLLVLIELMQRYTSLLALAGSLCAGVGLAWYAQRLWPQPEVMQLALAASILLLGALCLLLLLLIGFRFRFSLQLSRQLICLFLIPLGMSLFLLWRGHGEQVFAAAGLLVGLARGAAPLPLTEGLFEQYAGLPFVLSCLSAGLAINLFYYVYFTLWGRFLRKHFSPRS